MKAQRLLREAGSIVLCSALIVFVNVAAGVAAKATSMPQHAFRFVIGNAGAPVKNQGLRVSAGSGPMDAVMTSLGYTEAGLQVLNVTGVGTTNGQAAVAAAIRRVRGVAWVESDLLRSVGLVVNDPYVVSGQMWGLTGAYGVDASTAWDLTTGSPDVVVAVLDTGITSHPDLDSQIVAGFDMISDPTVAGDGDGRDSNPADVGDWTATSSSTWHGTHVAGTIVATSNNSVGISGVAPSARVQPVRVLGHGGGFTSDIAAGIIWAAGGNVAGVPTNTTPARVINMSLGGDGACSNAEQTAIDFAYSRGVVVVAAAGNSAGDAAMASPANCSHVIAVAASTSVGSRATFSNFGATVDISAPGVSIFSTVNSGSTVPVAPGYAAYSGTSMAAPHVAGVIALMLAVDSALTPDSILAYLRSTVLATSFAGGQCDPNPSIACGAGIVNATKLVDALHPLRPGLVPVFGDAISTPDGFSVAVSNVASAYTYAVASSSGQAVASLITNETMNIDVTGLAPGAEAVLTITCSRDGYSTVSATKVARALSALAQPQLIEVVETPTGLTATIANYEPSATYGLQATVGAATFGALGATGMGLVVTGVAPGVETVLTVTVEDASRRASTSVSGFALIPGVEPDLGAALSGIGGFSVPLLNFDSAATYSYRASSGRAYLRADDSGQARFDVEGLPQGQTASLLVGVCGLHRTCMYRSVTGRSMSPTRPSIVEVTSFGVVRGRAQVRWRALKGTSLDTFDVQVRVSRVGGKRPFSAWVSVGSHVTYKSAPLKAKGIYRVQLRVRNGELYGPVTLLTVRR